MKNIENILIILAAILLFRKKKTYPDKTNVSPHFTWPEWTVTETNSLKYLIPRVIQDFTAPMRANAQRVTDDILEPLRVLIGKPIKIRSGYRPAYLNAPSGGASGSQHLTASAADISVIDGKPADYEKIMQWARHNREKFGQVIFYFHVRPTGPGDSHRVHVSIPGNRTGNVKWHGGGYNYKDILPSIS